MDRSYNISEYTSAQESGKSPSYPPVSDIYSNGSNNSNIDGSLRERERDPSTSPSIIDMKSRLKSPKVDQPKPFSISEFPALSTPPNGMYHGNYLGVSYQQRPILGKNLSFKMEKEEFPALATTSKVPETSQLSSDSSQAPKASDKTEIVQKFGLLGLLRKMSDEGKKNNPGIFDRNFLDFGIDVPVLDLDVNAKTSLSTQLTSLFYSKTSNTKKTKTDPSFEIPNCYVKTKKTGNSNLSELSCRTLLYIFYAFPKDVKQVLVAIELYKRHWKYAIEEQIWLIRKQDHEEISQDLERRPIPSYADITFDVVSCREIMYTGKAKESADFLSLDSLTSLLKNHINT